MAIDNIAELEKLDLASPTCPLTLKEAVMEAARIIYVAHEDSKDKDFELEMTWIPTRSGLAAIYSLIP